MNQAWEEGPDVSTPAVLRALRAEERSRERTRIRDLLTAEMLKAEERAAATRSYRAGNTASGKRAAGLRAAVELLDEDSPEPGTLWSSVVGQDSVDTYRCDGGGEDGPDPLQVRIVVHDSCELVSAVAYLDLEQAEQHAKDVLQLVTEIRAARQAQEV